MIYRLCAIGLGLLCAGVIACGRTEIDGPFAAAAGTLPITTGASGGGESTGVAGAGSGGAGALGSGAAGAGASAGAAGNSTGAAGSSSTGEAGGEGQAGSQGIGGSSETGAAGSGQGGSGGSSGVGDACNPVSQNCGPGLRCDLPDSGPLAFECIIDVGGSGTEGQICRESGQDCAKGATCIQGVDRAGTPIGPARCFVFCNRRADCPQGDRCRSEEH